MNLIQLILGLILIINFITLISVVFYEKRETNVVLAWIMVFLFLPYLGFILYFFFGSSSKMKVFSKKYKLDEFEKEYEKIIIDDKYIFDKHNNLLLNNNVELYSKKDKAFKKMYEDIDNAKTSIHIAYYIIKMNDEISKELIKLLLKKLNENVEVRIIYDMYGDIFSSKKNYKVLIEKGAEVYPYVPSKIKRFLTLNYHYHRKMLIIDGLIAHIGGINIGNEYYKDYKRKPMWRDTNIRITGSAVNIIQLRFLSDFAFLKKQTKNKKNLNKNDIKSLFPKPIEKNNMKIQISSSGPDSKYPYIKDQYFKIINNAKKSIYIQTPYFVPDTTLLESLRISALNGCDIKIIIPGFFPTKKYAYYTSVSFAEELLKYGVKIYLYNGFIHSKTIVIDDYISSVGTTNFDIRSFRLNYEINAFIYNTKFAKKMVETFNEDILNSKQIKQDINKKWYNRFLESIFRLLAPLV